MEQWQKNNEVVGKGGGSPQARLSPIEDSEIRLEANEGLAEYWNTQEEIEKSMLAKTERKIMNKEFKVGEEVSVEFMGEVFEIHKYGGKILYKVRVAEFDLNMAEVESNKLFKLPTEEEIKKKKIDKK